MLVNEMKIETRNNSYNIKAQLCLDIFFLISDEEKYSENKIKCQNSISSSDAAIKISINATAAGFICKSIFPTPVQVKKI